MADAPTQLTPEVPSHRKPARKFQVIGVFVLVVGAIVGSYAALSKDSEPTLAAEPGVLVPNEGLAADEVLWRSYVKQKAQAAAEAEAERARRAAEIAAQQEAAKRTTPLPNVPSSCDEYTGNRALGCALLLEAGFGLDQMPCLDSLWTGESGWNENAHNPSSGAHGIPQSLPASKMASFGDDYMTNPVPQIRWGLDYIKDRYNTPCEAWNIWQSRSPHWY